MGYLIEGGNRQDSAGQKEAAFHREESIIQIGCDKIRKDKI